MSESVLIVRKRLLPYSETFIAAQAGALTRFRPVFAGIKRAASGAELLQQHRVLLQDEYARIPALARGLLSATGKPDARWLKAISAESPALVHAHFGPSGRLGLVLGSALKIPVLVTFHGYDITRHSSNRRYRHQRQQIFEQADRVIAVSDFISRKLADAGCPEDKIVRHYIGLDTRPYLVSKVEKSKAPHLVFVGRLIKQKGCSYLIRAMQRIKKIHHQAQLDIVGDGPELHSLKLLAGSTAGIRFLGRQSPDQVRELLGRAWVLCNPSIIDDSGATEGLGMVFLEAQAAGTPAVSFATGGVTEAIVDGITGYTLPHADGEKLTSCLLELIENQQLREAMGQAARAHIAEHFDLEKQCEKLEAIYHSVI